MLAYYVQWHMLEAWGPLLFCDEDQQAKASRDPAHPHSKSSPSPTPGSKGIRSYLSVFGLLGVASDAALEGFRALEQEYPDDGLVAFCCRKLATGDIGSNAVMADK